MIKFIKHVWSSTYCTWLMAANVINWLLIMLISSRMGNSLMVIAIVACSILIGIDFRSHENEEKES